MNWYWRARIYNTEGNRCLLCQIKTSPELSEIDAIQDFYAAMTGCKILLEGMSVIPDPDVIDMREAFNRLWQPSAIVKPATKPLTDWQQDQAETTRILRKRVGDDPS